MTPVAPLGKQMGSAGIHDLISLFTRTDQEVE